MRLTRPLSACAPPAPMSLPARLRLVRLTRPLSACAPSSPMPLLLQQVEAGEVDEALRAPAPPRPDVVVDQVEAGEVDEALERLRPSSPMSLSARLRLVRLTRPLSAVPLGPDALPARSRLVRLTRPFSACAPSAPMACGRGW